VKILITGHKGFIGSQLLAHFSLAHEVNGFGWGDAVPDISKYDWVIHEGAVSSTTDTDIERVMSKNFDFSCWLLNECIKHSTNLQYASSASVYGTGGSDFKESSPAAPSNLYAWSKYMFERYATMCAPAHIIVQGFRYFNVYGDGEGCKGAQASPYYKFRGQSEVSVFEGSDLVRRDFVPISLVVDYHAKFLRSKESGIWNIGTGTTTSFMEIAESFGVPIKTIKMPDDIGKAYQKYTCANMGKTNRTLA